jgi:hypothetical protein
VERKRISNYSSIININILVDARVNFLGDEKKYNLVATPANGVVIPYVVDFADSPPKDPTCKGFKEIAFSRFHYINMPNV